MKTRNPIPNGFDTGKLIRDALKRTRNTQAVIARKTGRNSSSVNNLLKQRSTQSSILHEISLALEVDLFAELSRKLPEHVQGKATDSDLIAQRQMNLQLMQQITQLEAEVAQLREDNTYLKKAIDLIAVKK